MKYVCPECNIKLWGKPNLNIIWGIAIQHYNLANCQC